MKATLSSTILLILVLASVFSCKDDDTRASSNDNTLAELRMEMANNLATKMIPSAYDYFMQDLNVLEQDLSNFELETTASHLQQLKNSHLKAWDTWQSVSIYQFGPAQDNALRTVVNTYPSDVEKIEANISEAIYTLNNLSNFDAIGFPAMDYLINSKETDVTVSDFKINTNRFEYFKSVLSIIKSTTLTVQNEFISGDFQNNFTSSNSNGIDVGSALGILMNSIDFHFQRDIRDAKVAIPAGIRSAGIPRTSNVEAFYSSESRDLLISSLRAYRQLFNGIDSAKNNGTSVIDYLVALEREDIADDLNAKIDDVIIYSNTLDPNLANQIESDNDKMIALFMQLQDIVTLIKSDMVSVMGISITNQDNDGD